MTHWALLIEYDGASFSGWQRQDGQPTVQAVLEDAAERLCGVPTPSTVAGRTDAGGARGRPGGDAGPARPSGRRPGARGAELPHEAAPGGVLRAAIAPDGWNPRFSAIGRAYRYRILNRRARPALLLGRVWHVPHALDAAAMAEGARHLLGVARFHPRSAPRRARRKARCARWTGWT